MNAASDWECPTCGKRTYPFLHSCPYKGMPHHWWVEKPTAIDVPRHAQEDE